MKGLIAAMASALFLTGCINDGAYFESGGPQDTISVVRTQSFLWQKDVEIEVVVAHPPECQRRFKVGRSPIVNFQLQVYRSAEGPYILNEDDDWYVIDAKTCRMQKFDNKPPFPGDYIGEFEDDNRRLIFTPAKQPGKKAGK